MSSTTSKSNAAMANSNEELDTGNGLMLEMVYEYCQIKYMLYADAERNLAVTDGVQ